VTNSLETGLRDALAERVDAVHARPDLLAAVRAKRTAQSRRTALTAGVTALAFGVAGTWGALEARRPASPMPTANPYGVAARVTPAPPLTWSSPGMTVLGTPVIIGQVADPAHGRRLDAVVFYAHAARSGSMLLACPGTTPHGSGVITVSDNNCEGYADQLTSAPYQGAVPALPGGLDAEADTPESLWVQVVSDKVAWGGMYLLDGTLRPGRLIPSGDPAIPFEWFIVDHSGTGSGAQLRDANGAILYDTPVNERR
jgi:hypothetical protein